MCDTTWIIFQVLETNFGIPAMYHSPDIESMLGLETFMFDNLGVGGSPQGPRAGLTPRGAESGYFWRNLNQWLV